MDNNNDEFPELESEMYEPSSLGEGETAFEQVDVKDVPVDLHLEVGKMKVSLEELQRLQPGSKLPLEINPRIVHLTVGGKSIGRGELIEIGETIGVKILELY